MSYEIEDEIDWSDGPLGPPTPAGPETAAPLGCSDDSPQPSETDSMNELFVAETDLLEGTSVIEPVNDYEMRSGSPLSFTYKVGGEIRSVPSRSQRARLGVHLNRRQPSKDDYKNFALYSANQKAYEADVLKKFVSHALHPDRVVECLEASPGDSGGIALYLRSVLQNVRSLTDKMVWNARCRAVNLLANDGIDGIPFLDLQQVGQGMFSDFRYDNLVLVAERMNESWHRAYPEPAMVRISTKQYPIGCHSSPLEEIDETADQVFNNREFINKLATGRAINASSKKKGKGRGLPGMALRDDVTNLARDQWLSSLTADTTYLPATHKHAAFPPAHHHAGPSRYRKNEHHNNGSNFEPQLLQDLRNMQQAEESSYSHLQAPTIIENVEEPPSTRLEELVDLYGGEALNSDRGADEASDSVFDIAAEVPSWRSTLLNDHKRRLTERFPQTLRRALPGIKQVIANTIAMGWRCTDQDQQRKLTIIEAKEQPRKIYPSSPARNTEPTQRRAEEPLLLHRSGPRRNAAHTISTKKRRTDTAKKRQKTISGSPITKKRKTSPKKKKVATPRSTQKAVLAQPQLQVEDNSTGLPVRHPSGLEAHQALPPNAYFEPQSPDEQPAWRCGIQHAMGYYYNAGNRSSCLGCNTNVKDNVNKKVMDFYLPHSSWSYQPAPPGIVWRAPKPRDQPRRTKSRIHNSIAKDAYWPVFNETGDEMLAWQAGIAAVEAVFESRKPKEPTPEPTPETEPDVGPHPSGSTTMEHGQDIPECAYFEPQDEDEVYASRCDVSHALGRYYLSGDKRSCPGCGTNRGGAGKHTVMDFYMPPGVYVRQEAPGLVQWKPRKPYKVKTKPGKGNGNEEGNEKEKKKYLVHNQNCSRKYFEAVDEGYEHEEALRTAVAALEAELDEKEADIDSEDGEEESSAGSPSSTSTSSPKKSSNTSQTSSASSSKPRRSPRQTHSVAPIVPAKRYREASSDDEEENDGEPGYADEDEQQDDSIPDIIEISSSDDDEETSGSDSE